jgi:hypothetical protein
MFGNNEHLISDHIYKIKLGHFGRREDRQGKLLVSVQFDHHHESGGFRD